MIIHGLDYYIEKGRAMNFTIQILQGQSIIDFQILINNS